MKDLFHIIHSHLTHCVYKKNRIASDYTITSGNHISLEVNTADVMFIKDSFHLDNNTNNTLANILACILLVSYNGDVGNEAFAIVALVVNCLG